jgi:hypothetical protein
MNGLSDSLTIGLLLALVFGALFFYLYTRVSQVEKRVSLTENILLDLKVATENTIMAMSQPAPPHMHMHEEVMSVEPISAPAPLAKEEIEEVNEEEFYKSVLAQASGSQETKNQDAVPVHESIQGVKMEVNYESMTLKELKEEAKRRGIKVSATAHKKDVIDALKRSTQPSLSLLEPVPGTQGEEGFPVELGSD